MTCVHGNLGGDDSWGGCIHCAEEERHRKFYEKHKPPEQYDFSEPIFDCNPLYYHIRLENTSIISVGEQFSIINYQGNSISIPNKIIRLKGEKSKLYVHHRIFNSILTKNGLPNITL